MSKFGITVTNLNDLSLVSHLDYDYIELMGKTIASLENEELTHLVYTLKEHGIKVYGCNAYCNQDVIIAGLGYSSEKAKEYSYRCAQKMAILGVNVIGIGSPKSRRLTNGFDKNTASEEIQEFFEITCDAFLKYGILVLLEPLAPAYCNCINTLSEAERIVKKSRRINSGIIADLYNMRISNDESYHLLDSIDDIKHIHISDDEGTIWTRSYLKRRDIDSYANLLSAILSLGYQNRITLEIDKRISINDARLSLQILREITDKVR